MSKVQNQLVLDHLIDHGYITDLIARNYGVRRLAARIKDLRTQGVRIDSELQTDSSGVRYARYTPLAVAAEKARRRLGWGWKLQMFAPARAV